MTPLHPGDLTNYLGSVSPAERELRRLFLRHEPLTICDIGGCEGEESIRYARCFPRARIFCFEPLPANQRLIFANFARFGIQTAELVPLALSDRAGTAQFHVSSGQPPERFAGDNWNYGNKSSSLLPPATPQPMFGWVEFHETISVPTQTFDAFAVERNIPWVDFIHMDVQGAEHLVLAGAHRMLPRCTAVWLEVSDRELYRGQQLRTAIETLMAEAGFSKTLEFRREVEGDQFYVNRRCLRQWPYLAARRLVRWWRDSRALRLS